MNLETKIDSRLWDTIFNSYSNRQYKNAILDVFYFLSDLLREKTGLESDGHALVGQALGGNNPKLKVNKLQTESDRNVQQGLEQLLRGLYRSIRNPRSHGKFTDSKDNADTIILFINYLVGIIDQSKTPFSKSLFLNRVFEDDFVKKDRYAELLVKEIPVKKRLEVMFDVFRDKETGDGSKLVYFVRALMKKLTKDEKAQLFDVVSEELKHTDSIDTIRLILQIFPDRTLEKFDETARLRVENKLIESIMEGRYDRISNKCLKGVFGTWASSICCNFLLKQDLLRTIELKLNSSDITEQDYIFTYFFNVLPKLSPTPLSFLKTVVNNRLNQGNVRFWKALLPIMHNDKLESWQEAFSEAFNSFAKVENNTEAVVTDDEIPF